MTLPKQSKLRCMMIAMTKYAIIGNPKELSGRTSFNVETVTTSANRIVEMKDNLSPDSTGNAKTRDDRK